MGVHDGHRQRMIRRFMEEGLDHFKPHEVLELLLFFSIARRDTNEIAHELIDTFGSVSGVFSAPPEELAKVSGIGGNSVALLRLISSVTRYYMTEQTEDICLDSTRKTVSFLVPRFIGRTEEVVFLVCLDNKNKVLGTTLIHTGSVNAAEINIRKIVSTALKYNASRAILAHNHPSGIALPSEEDRFTTEQVARALESVDVRLIDHVVVADEDGVSFADMGLI